MVCEVEGDVVLVVTAVVALFQCFSFCIYHVGTSQIQRSLNRILHTALLNFVIGSLLWFTVGYSMVFGKSQKGFIGYMNHAFLLDLHKSRFRENETDCSLNSQSDVAMVTFEMAFAILAPVMVIITWIEYIKPAGAVLFLTLWPILVYYPVTHWIRGGGWLSTTLKVLDFAGGLTLHTTAGSSHLLLTIWTKKKFRLCEKLSVVDRYSQKTTKNSQTLILAIGSLFTTAGWYCLNVGSLRNFDNLYSLVLVNTHFAACGSILFWIPLSLVNGHWSLVDLFNGFMVGLAGASSFSGYVETWCAFLVGCVVGILSCGLLVLLKKHSSVCVRENSVDISFIFAVPAILGSIAVGLFSKTSVDSMAENGALFSNGIQLAYQLLGILVAIVWPMFWTSFLLKFIHSTIGFFVSESTAESSADSTLTHSNQEEASLKVRLMWAARNGNLQEIQELSETFNIDLGLKDSNQRTTLHYACEGGQIDCVNYLLDQREVDIHAKDRYGATPLFEAVRKRRDNLVPVLLECGANWVSDGVGELLCSYAAQGKIDEVRRLKTLGTNLNAADSHGRTALHIAASKGDKLMVECLIGMKVNPNKVDSFGNRPLNYSEMHEHEEVSETLVQHGALRISQNYSQREMCEEASKGNLRMLRHMVHNGASVCYCDEYGRTTLHTSSEAGHLDIVKFLLTQPGVNVNARDKKNNTPLTDAISNMHNDVADYLRIHGGEVEERRMMHLMCKAIQRCDRRLLRQLLQWFNGSTVVDYDGQSAYHICVNMGDADMLRILAKAGINFKEVNYLGHTPLEFAIQLESNCSIIQMLSDLEEGTFSTYSSQLSLADQKPVHNTKSKIRRRRTRRQTGRVEVAPTDFLDKEEAMPEKINNGYGDISLDKKVPRRVNNLNTQVNGMQKDIPRPKHIPRPKLEEPRIIEGKAEESEVTLADIELMNRKKPFLNELKFSERIGAPQYV